MKRLLFILQIIVLCLSLLLIPRLYREKITTYRAAHPSNEVIEKEIVQIEGYFASINIDKEQGIFIGKNGQSFLMRSLSEQVIKDCLDGRFAGQISINGNQRQWNATKNTDVFDYDAYLFSEGYSGVFDTIDYVPSSEHTFHPILGVKYHLLRTLYQEDDSSLNQTLLAMFFKQKNQFDDYDTYQSLGVLHLFAVSGLHFGVIYLLLSKILLIPHAQFKHFLIAMLMLVFYAFMGRSYSSFRAMTCIFYIEIAQISHRKIDFLSLFALSHILTLLFYPYAILSTAYLLSFYIYFVVAFLIPILTQGPFKYKKITGAILLQILTFPVTLMLFNEVNLLSFVSNLILIPIYSGLVILLIPYLVLMWGIPPIAAWVSPLMNRLTDLIHQLVVHLPHYSFIGSLKASLFYKILLLILVMISVRYLFYLKKNTQKRLVLIAVLVISLTCVEPAYNGLCIDVIDVGHGDGTLVTYHGKTILIDTGKSSAPTQSFLVNQSLKEIDYLILSHSHQDHIGSVIKISQQWPIGCIICMADTHDLLIEEGIEASPYPIHWEVMDPSKEKNIAIDDLTLTLTASHDSQDPNDNGLLTLLNLNNFDAVFTGDYSLNNLLTQSLPHEIDYYKMPHHGSKTSYSPSFFRDHLVRLISISHHTQYHFPDRELIPLLEQLHIPYQSTFFKGQIHMELHGNKLKINNFFNEHLLIDVSSS